jgi:hypothetical protein
MSGLFSPSNIEWLNQEGRRGYALTPFRGCAYGCSYCWSREIQRIPYEQWVRPRLRQAFQGVDLFAQAMRAPQGANVLLSASTDPFQPIGMGYDTIVESLLRGLGYARDVQVWVLTKSGKGILRHLDALQGARLGVTLTTLESNTYEQRAEGPGMRLLGLRTAKERGCPTFISIEPWIKGVTDPRAIIEKTQDYCDFWIVGSHNRRLRPIELPPGAAAVAGVAGEGGLEGEGLGEVRVTRAIGLGRRAIGDGRDHLSPVRRSPPDSRLCRWAAQELLLVRPMWPIYNEGDMAAG